MRKNNRNSIASMGKLPQFTTMNVIDGQAGLVNYSSLIFYSLTIDNILNIIVLLILAGVTIATLTGENGILSKAQNAKTQNDKASEKEQIELAVLASKINTDASIDKKILKEELERISGVIESGVPTSVDYTIPLTVTGKTGTKYEINANGVVQKIDGAGTNEKPGKPDETGLFTETDRINGGLASANNPTIPAGFKPIDTSTSRWGDGSAAPSEESVKNGLVITDGTSEFVWIPVETLSEMAEEIDGTNDANGNKKYRGVLYDFGSTLEENDKRSWGVNDYREPDNLTGEGKSPDHEFFVFDSPEMFAAQEAGTYTDSMYQEEYDKMVASVAKFKGFYVGRYETSLNNATATDTGDSDSTSVQSKAGVQSANGAMYKNRENDIQYAWYGLYSMSKTYAPESDTSKSVVSSMIWGSQYDAMMRWMQENGIDVTECPDYTPSETLQNAVINDTSVTGAEDSKDKLNNIYDLLGNSWEWTLEAYDVDTRVPRGGARGMLDEGFNITSSGGRDKGTLNPSERYCTAHGSRLTLYIK